MQAEDGSCAQQRANTATDIHCKSDTELDLHACTSDVKTVRMYAFVGHTRGVWRRHIHHYGVCKGQQLLNPLDKVCRPILRLFVFPKVNKQYLQQSTVVKPAAHVELALPLLMLPTPPVTPQ